MDNNILNFNFPINNSTSNQIVNDEILYVILPFYNFAKAKSRTRLFLEFIERYKNLTKIRLIIVEATTIDQQFQLPKNLNEFVYMHLKFELESPFWCKENLINVAISKLYTAESKLELCCMDWY
jgi:hypothetical protein